MNSGRKDAARMRKLDVFDFDGTLFRNPLDTPDNRRKYEQDKGLPWLIDKETSRQLSKKLGRFVPMRRGWYGRPETLEPPLVPDPTPSGMFLEEPRAAFLQSKADPSAITVLLTGRHVGLKNHVLRIAADGGLVKIRRKYSQEKQLFCDVADENVTCIFLGDNGPKPKGTKPSSTLPWKLWILEQFLDLHPELEIVEIWEDRDEHVKEFQALDEILEQKVIVHHVTGHGGDDD